MGEFVEYNKHYKDMLCNTFCSTYAVFDEFIRDNLSLDEKHGKTYIYLNEQKNKIIAYFNITTGLILDLTTNTSNGGAIYINYFALDKEYQGKESDTKDAKVSDYLFDKCIEKIKEIRDKYVGFTFITLHSTELGYNLYKRYGFDDAEEDMNIPAENKDVNRPMYLALDDINV